MTMMTTEHAGDDTTVDNRLSFGENNCNHEYDDDGNYFRRRHTYGCSDGIIKGTDVNTNYGSKMKLWAKACKNDRLR